MTADISVVVPTFHREQQLAEALASVLSQTGARVEVFVVDDSPEGSAGSVVCAAKDERVRYLRNPHPTGGNPSIVRNLALPLASAPLIHFLDDDDIVPAGHYARVRRAFAANADIGMIFGAVQPFGSGPIDQLESEQRYFSTSLRLAARCQSLHTRLAFVASLLFVHALLVCGAGIVRREAALALRGFDARLRVREDIDFFAFVSRRFGVRFLDEPALHYRISSNGSLMHTANLSPEQSERQRQLLQQARSMTNAKYIASWGYSEYLALQVLARTALRLL
jgi:glycosyltransferase involved in cell wall biosynthesis